MPSEEKALSYHEKQPWVIRCFVTMSETTEMFHSALIAIWAIWHLVCSMQPKSKTLNYFSVVFIILFIYLTSILLSKRLRTISFLQWWPSKCLKTLSSKGKTNSETADRGVAFWYKSSFNCNALVLRQILEQKRLKMPTDKTQLLSAWLDNTTDNWRYASVWFEWTDP